MRTLFLSILVALAPAIATAQQAESSLQSDPAVDYFSRVQQLYDAAAQESDPATQAELYRRAIPLLSDYVRTHPRHRLAQTANYYLGESYYALGQTRQANMTFELIIQKYRSGSYVAASAYRLAYYNYNAKQYQRAARLFQLTASNAQKPEDKLRSIYFQAQCYLLLKEPQRAYPLLDKVANSADESPYKAQAKIASAHILLGQKKYALALPLYEALIQPGIDDQLLAETNYHAGVCASALGKDALARQYFSASLLAEGSPWKASSHIALLGLHYKDKNYDAILKQVKATVVGLDKKQRASEGVIVGQTYFQKKNYSKAVEYFLQVESAVPGSDQAFEAAYYKLLCLYNIEGENIPKRVDLFIQNYAVGRGTSKQIHLALLMKAETLYGQKKYKEAAESYNAISTQFIDAKNLPSLLYKQGWCLSEISNHSGAVHSFSQFIELAPDDKRINNAHAKRAQSYMELGNRVKALRDFDVVIKKAPKSNIAAVALQLSSRIQRDAKNYDDVVDRLEKLLKLHPNLNDAAKGNSHYWLGSAYFKLDNFKKAIPHLERAQSMDKAAYGKQSFMLLILSHYSLKDVDGLKSIISGIKDPELAEQVPLPVYRWLGSQCYNAGDYAEAAQYLINGCEKGVARTTPAVIWRLLTKAQYKSQQYDAALTSVDNLLSVETDDAHRVSALLDKAKILLHLKKYKKAQAIGEKALVLRPSGKVKANLLLTLGDTAYLTGDYTAASDHYVLVVENFGDLEAHSQALSKLINALEKAQKTAAAKSYQDILKKDYPDHQQAKTFTISE